VWLISAPGHGQELVTRQSLFGALIVHRGGARDRAGGALDRRGTTEDTRRVWLARLKWLVES
jgi:hypothetical protein